MLINHLLGIEQFCHRPLLFLLLVKFSRGRRSQRSSGSSVVNSGQQLQVNSVLSHVHVVNLRKKVNWLKKSCVRKVVAQVWCKIFLN